MLSFRKASRGGIVASAALLALALATPSWAGQINLSARTTLIAESISSAGSTSVTRSIQGSAISEAISGSVASTISRSIQIFETFSATSATVSFEVAQEGLNYTSPFDNVLSTSSILQALSIASTSGITNVQITAGAGNVSVASTSLIDGGVLASVTGSIGASTTSVGATNAVTLALVPGFALQNSNVNALVLSATNAIAGSQGPGEDGARTAIDIEQVDLNEYSPHGNIAAIGGGLTQSIGIGGTSGVSAVQVQVGAGNVQANHTILLFSVTGADLFGS